MRQGDIVALEFPFSDLSEKKFRPAVILSHASYNRNKNVILAGIYGSRTPLSIPLSNADLTKKKLKKDSYISLQNIFSAEKKLLIKSVDSLSKKKLTAVLGEVRSCFS